MLHIAENIQCPAEYLKYLLKLFSMLNISITYDDTIDNKNVPKDVGIMYINCGKLYFLVRQSRDKKIHHYFCYKYGVTAYWFIVDHSAKQKPKL